MASGYSQLLPQASDLGLGVRQLHGQVLATLSAPHAGRVVGGLGVGRQGRELATVPLLGQLHDGLTRQRGTGLVTSLHHSVRTQHNTATGSYSSRGNTTQKNKRFENELPEYLVGLGIVFTEYRDRPSSIIIYI